MLDDTAETYAIQFGDDEPMYASDDPAFIWSMFNLWIGTVGWPRETTRIVKRTINTEWVAI